MWFLTEPRDSRLPPQQAHVEVSATEDGAEVNVTAEVLLRDLTLLVDKIHPSAVVDRALVTLLPEESTTFRITGVDDSTSTPSWHPVSCGRAMSS